MRIITGGQTGADQGGLRGARAAGQQTGGWVPKGCRTEDGPAPWLLTGYECQEHALAQYAPRTVANVRMAEALIWIGDTDSPGGRLTLERARLEGVPVLTLSFPATFPLEGAIRLVRNWLYHPDRTPRVGVLMVAGNREGLNPGVGAYTEMLMREVLTE